MASNYPEPEPGNPGHELDRLVADLDGILAAMDKGKVELTLPEPPNFPRSVEEPETEPPRAVEAVEALDPSPAPPMPRVSPDPEVLPPRPGSPIRAVQAPQAPQASPAPVDAPVGEGPWVTLPEDVQSQQVRRVAFVHLPGLKPAADRFARVMVELAQKSSKQPFFVVPTGFSEFKMEMDLRTLSSRARSDRAVALVVVVENDDQRTDIEAVFSEEVLFIKVLTADETGKRSAGVDLIVDLLLLKGSV